MVSDNKSRNVVGSREMIMNLLENNGGKISLRDIRRYAIGEIGNFYLVGVFMSISDWIVI